MTSLFDAYADAYREEVERATAFSGRDLSFFTQAKADVVLELTTELVGDPGGLRALDVGCGTGETDALLGAFGELHGVDVAAEPLRRARARNPAVTYTHYDAERLPYGDAGFDLVFAICVLHHVAPRRRRRFAAELRRVVRPGGVAVVVEHNPLNPLTRLVVARCRFDRDALLVGRGHATGLLREAGLAPVCARYILFFPWRNGVWRDVERRLAFAPVGAQYLVAARRPS